MNESVPPVPSLPVLSPSLLTTFGSLCGGGVERRLFKRLYIAVWHYLWPIRRMDEVAQAYTIPGALGLIKPSVSISQWFLLSRLWVLSGSGAVALDSRNYTFTSSQRHYVADLINMGLLIRTSFDPAAPHAVKPSHIQRTYISFTPAGVRYYRVVVKESNKRLMNDLYPSIGSSK